MADNLVLNDTHIRGLISGAVEREHAVAKAIFKATNGGSFRQVRPTDTPTRSRTGLKRLETLWQPILSQVYAMPAAQALKGVLPDPQIGKMRIEVPAKSGGAV